jgi:hypothetical protein
VLELQAETRRLQAEVDRLRQHTTRTHPGQA